MFLAEWSAKGVGWSGSMSKLKSADCGSRSGVCETDWSRVAGGAAAGWGV